MLTEEPFFTTKQLLKRWPGMSEYELRNKLSEELSKTSGRAVPPTEPGEGFPPGWLEGIEGLQSEREKISEPGGGQPTAKKYFIPPFFPEFFVRLGRERLNHNTGNIIWDVDPPSALAVEYAHPSAFIKHYFEIICFKEAEIERYEKDHPEFFYQTVDADDLTATPAETLEVEAGPDKVNDSNMGDSPVSQDQPNAEQKPEAPGVESARLPIRLLLEAIKAEADKRKLLSGYIKTDRAVRTWLNGSSPSKCGFTAETLRSQKAIDEFAKIYIASIISSGSSELAANAKKNVTLNEGLSQLKVETPEDVLLLKEAAEDLLRNNKKTSGRK